MEDDFTVLTEILIALAIGLLIGIERGWSGRKEDEGDRLAGLRTFSLIGLLGGVWAQLAGILSEWILAVSFIAIAALVITGHLIDARRSNDVGTTTAFAMLLTFSLAAWSGFGYYLPALATTVIVVALLSMKPMLHKWLQHINTNEISAGIKLLIISVVLLPLLPDEGFGPWDALNPFWIWLMVVLICGISFVGYIAMNFAGRKLGALITAISGGLASSTAVTLSMAQFAMERVSKSIFMSGVMVASSIMCIRVAIEVFVVNPDLIELLWLPLSLLFFSIIAGAAWFWYKSGSGEPESAEPDLRNPFRLTTAIKFGLLLGVILVLAAFMQEQFGDQGVYVLSVISGLMDVDAITLSLSRLALDDLAARTAVIGIILASVTNTIVKGFIFAFFVGMKESWKLIVVLILSTIPALIAVFFIG